MKIIIYKASGIGVIECDSAEFTGNEYEKSVITCSKRWACEDVVLVEHDLSDAIKIEVTL